MRSFALPFVPAVLLLTGFAPAPTQDGTERWLKAYCSRTGTPRDRLEPCRLGLFPGAKVYRFPLAAEKEAQGLPARFVVLVVHPGGDVAELKMSNWEARHACLGKILAAMRKAGRKVKSAGDAERALRDLHRLSCWVTGMGDEKRCDRLTVAGRYRGREGTYGAGVWCLGLICGDDLGMAVDKEGFVEHLLSGHVK
jgi:hypothetical protein